MFSVYIFFHNERYDKSNKKVFHNFKTIVVMQMYTPFKSINYVTLCRTNSEQSKDYLKPRRCLLL